MKPSVSLSLFPGSPTAPILFRGNLEQSVPTIAGLGYEGVDLFVGDENGSLARKALRLLRSNGLGVGVVMPAALAGKGLFLGDRNPDIRDAAVKRLYGFVSFAAEAGGMVSLGLVRGSLLPGDTLPEFEKRFADSVMRLLPHATELGVPLVIEPINRYEINTMCSSLEALSFIERFSLPVGLMLDTFHMNIEDVSLPASLRVCARYVRHVHFVDSNRLAPGMGHLDMRFLLKTLKEIGYDGYLCLEALDRPDGLTVARKGMEFFHGVQDILRGKDSGAGK